MKRLLNVVGIVFFALIPATLTIKMVQSPTKLAEYDVFVLIFLAVLCAAMLTSVYMEMEPEEELTEEQKWLLWEEEMMKKRAAEEENEHPSWVNDMYR